MQINKTFFFFFLFFSACQMPLSTNKVECDPDFFLNYEPKNNEIVGIGIAPPNLNGVSAQKKSAISKALEEIAKQKNTKISSVSLMSLKGNKFDINRQLKSYSLQTVDGIKIKAKIIKACKAKNDYYYVLMKAY